MMVTSVFLLFLFSIKRDGKSGNEKLVKMKFFVDALTR
jgi:hypothetical protein